MNKIFKFIFVTFYLFNFFDIKSFELESLNFYEWYNQSTKNEIKEEDFLDIINKSNETHINIINDKDVWPLISQDNFPEFQNNLKKLNPKLPEYIFKPKDETPEEFKTSQYIPEINPILPCTAKINTPTNYNIYVFGDFHGNFLDFSFIYENLLEEEVINDNFELTKNSILIFLGDYTDRGPNSLELLTTLMILKIKNPYNVFLLRGNHEDLIMNVIYGFHSEIFNKIKNNKNRNNIIKQITKSYELMPTSLYLENENKTQIIHLSHAGFEIRNNPKKFIESEIKNDKNIQFDLIKKIPEEEFENIFSDFCGEIIRNFISFSLNENLYTLWNDFYEYNEEEICISFSIRSNGSLTHNYKFLEYVLNKYNLQNKIVKFIRGHSHTHVKFPKKEPSDDNEFIKLCKKFSYGTTPVNKKVITLISGSINYTDFNMHFLPTYLKLTQKDKNHWLVEAKSLNTELLNNF